MKATVRPQLVKAAIEMFGRYSVQGVTTRDLAKKADVTEGSLYNLFGSREVLYSEALNAVVHEANQGFTKFVVSELAKSQEFNAKRLEQALQTWFSSLSQSNARLLVQVLFNDEKLKTTACQPLENMIGVVAQSLDRQKRANRKFDSHATATSLIRSLVWAKVEHSKEDDANRDASEILQWFLATPD